MSYLYEYKIINRYGKKALPTLFMKRFIKYTAGKLFHGTTAAAVAKVSRPFYHLRTETKNEIALIEPNHQVRKKNSSAGLHSQINTCVANYCYIDCE